MSNELLTADDLIILAQQDAATLADWWCILNRHEWPEELPNPDPRVKYEIEWRGQPKSVERNGYRSRAIMQWIENRVGMRLCSRHWNKGMTDEEHDDFWRGTYEGNADAKARDEARLMRQVLREQRLLR